VPRLLFAANHNINIKNNLMKTILLAGLAIVLSVCVVAVAQPSAKKEKLRHVVALKFKESATREQIKEVEDAFRGLKRGIPQIADFEWGTNVSPEKHDKGFTHVFLLTYNTEKDRDEYLVHPEHKKFVELLVPIMADAFVVDYWAKD
jgi:hypothetical protein